MTFGCSSILAIGIRKFIDCLANTLTRKEVYYNKGAERFFLSKEHGTDLHFNENNLVGSNLLERGCELALYGFGFLHAVLSSD